MNVMFHDLHDNHELREDLDDDKVLGALFHEILYADDTIIYSRNTRTLYNLLHAIETEGETYGLKLNHSKCEAMTHYNADSLVYKNFEKVKNVDEAKYLGCMLEIKDKLVVYDAVIRAKLMYGRESIQLSKEWTNKWYGKLDTCHLKRF